MDSIKYVLISMLATKKNSNRSQKLKGLPYQGQYSHDKTAKIVINQLNILIFNCCEVLGSEMEGQA